MAIHIDEAGRVFTLHTAHSTYQMKSDDCGTLLHTYYGKRTDDFDKSYLIFYSAMRGFSGSPYDCTKAGYSLDVLPQEYSCFGTGDYRDTGLHVRHADGSNAAQLRYVSHRVLPGAQPIPGLPAAHGDCETLEVTLRDTASEVLVVLSYGVYESCDTITRSAKIVNTGSSPVVLEKAATLSLDWQRSDFDLITFHGRHGMERIPQRAAIQHGCQSVGSVRGASSHHYNPFALLCDHTADETHGDCYGIGFVYSGEFLLEVSRDQAEQTRLLLGIHPDNFRWTLEPGTAFDAPQAVLAFSENGLTPLTHRLHDFVRGHIISPVWANRRRPVLINNWEGTYFNFNGDKLVAIASEAAQLGIELFVMDDGWFGKRDDDTSGLGDWLPNEQKLGCTLHELGERINRLGMQFGIWLEPECISEDSDLYRAHPDWAVQIPGRAPNLSRQQLILDLSRADVQDYLIERLTAVLESAPISYVKWDFNRSICDKFSHALPAARQGEMAHRFVLGLYRVLSSLLARFPELLIEGCSGGGGRFDLGMLCYTPQIWCSDNTDAIARLTIQYGTSFCYPVSTMGAHVSAVPNHQTGRTAPLATRGIVAMSGTFGYELDLSKLSDAEKEEIRTQVALFKTLCPVLQHGDYYRLTSPQSESCTVWQQASKDGRCAVLSAVFHHNQTNPSPTQVRLCGLTRDALYKVQLLGMESESFPPFLDPTANGRGLFLSEPRISGAALMDCGLTIPASLQEFGAKMIVLTREDAL